MKFGSPRWGGNRLIAERRDHMRVRRSLQRICLLVPLAALLPLVGCTMCGPSLDDEAIFYSGYWRRHVNKFSEDLHAWRIDIDRTVFGLEDVPVENQ